MRLLCYMKSDEVHSRSENNLLVKQIRGHIRELAAQGLDGPSRPSWQAGCYWERQEGETLRYAG
jgi:hypothetical protein